MTEDEYVPEVNIEETMQERHENWFQASIALNDELLMNNTLDTLTEAEHLFIDTFQKYMKPIMEMMKEREKQIQEEMNELLNGIGDSTD